MTEYILEKEIRQQPEVIRHLLDVENSNVQKIASSVKGKFDYILIAARGSSDNAARYAQYLFGTQNRLPVALATPSIFTIYNQPPQIKRALVIGISQSGQSPDIVQVISEAKLQGQPTIAITNDPDSPLAHASDSVIGLHAGAERAVAATKTYTSSLTCMAMLSAFLLGDPNRLAELLHLPSIMTDVLGIAEKYYQPIQRYRYMEHCVVLGRGLNYSTAFEIALKIKELTRTVAEPYSSADFRHGPIAMVREGFPVIMVAPSGVVMDDILEIVKDIRAIKGELLVISDNRYLLDISNLPLPLPGGVPEWLSPMISVIPGQMFAFLLAVVKGLNPDNPEGIQKITETY